MNSEQENSFWRVTDLSYQQAVNLAASDLIKDFQRDPSRSEAKFWPGSTGVFRYLSEHAPETSLILNDKGEGVRLERGTLNQKSFPVRRPAKMGMTISDD